MPQQISARLPDSLVEQLDKSAMKLRCSRTDVVRLALEYYLDDFVGAYVAIDRLLDPNDPVLDWNKVRRDLLNRDQ